MSIRMRTIIGIVLMGFSIFAQAEQWQLLTGNDSVRLLIDLDSIVKHDDIVEGRVRLIEQKTTVSTQDSMKFMMSCNRRRGAIAEWAVYQSLKDAPAQLKRYRNAPNISPEKFDVITPGTYGEAIWSFSCTWQTMKDRLLERLPLTP